MNIKPIFSKTYESTTVECFPIGTLGCNSTLIYSKNSKEAVLIDPGNDFPSLWNYLQTKNLKIMALIHTHAHFDHIGESSKFKEVTNAKLCLHKNDLELYKNLKMQGHFFGQKVGEVSEVDMFLEDESEFYIHDSNDKSNIKSHKKLQTFFTPGHTEGSCCFYLESFDRPILLAGDTLFRRSIGRTDLPGGDSDKIIKSIKNKLYQLPDETIIIPGHGPLTELWSEKKHNPFTR